MRLYKKDRYGRTIGKIRINGTDINRKMVGDGFAWQEYQREQSPDDRILYAQAEIAARNDRRGLWQDNNAISPSDFRRQRFLAVYKIPSKPPEVPASPGGVSGSNSTGGRVQVRSYTRRDGTVVRSHTRSRPR